MLTYTSPDLSKRLSSVSLTALSYIPGSQTCLHTGITPGPSKHPEAYTPPPEIVIKSVWGLVWALEFLRYSQVILLLCGQVWKSLSYIICKHVH